MNWILLCFAGIFFFFLSLLSSSFLRFFVLPSFLLSSSYFLYPYYLKRQVWWELNRTTRVVKSKFRSGDYARAKKNFFFRFRFLMYGLQIAKTVFFSFFFSFFSFLVLPFFSFLLSFFVRFLLFLPFFPLPFLLSLFIFIY